MKNTVTNNSVLSKAAAFVHKYAFTFTLLATICFAVALISLSSAQTRMVIADGNHDLAAIYLTMIAGLLTCGSLTLAIKTVDEVLHA